MTPWGDGGKVPSPLREYCSCTSHGSCSRNTARFWSVPETCLSTHLGQKAVFKAKECSFPGCSDVPQEALLGSGPASYAEGGGVKQGAWHPPRISMSVSAVTLAETEKVSSSTWNGSAISHVCRCWNDWHSGGHTTAWPGARQGPCAWYECLVLSREVLEAQSSVTASLPAGGG